MGLWCVVDALIQRQRLLYCRLEVARPRLLSTLLTFILRSRASFVWLKCSKFARGNLRLDLTSLDFVCVCRLLSQHELFQDGAEGAGVQWEDAASPSGRARSVTGLA